MAVRQTRIGGLETIEDIQIAIRDIENQLYQLIDQGVATLDVAPATPQVVVRLADGTYEIWNVVSTGGCTITKNAALKQIQISVP